MRRSCCHTRHNKKKYRCAPPDGGGAAVQHKAPSHRHPGRPSTQIGHPECSQRVAAIEVELHRRGLLSLPEVSCRPPLLPLAPPHSGAIIQHSPLQTSLLGRLSHRDAPSPTAMTLTKSKAFIRRSLPLRVSTAAGCRAGRRGRAGAAAAVGARRRRCRLPFHLGTCFSRRAPAEARPSGRLSRSAAADMRQPAGPAKGG